MKGWSKVNSYSKIYQAELYRDLLIENGINAVILNEKDSSFLLGDIELYVEDRNHEKSKVILGEFRGWSKIDSFIWRHQIELVQDRLEQNDIKTIILKRQTDSTLLSEFELYIKTKNLEKTSELLKNLQGWTIIGEFDKVIQAAFRVDKLRDYGIDTLVLNKRDDNYNLLEIELYVEEKNSDRSKSLISSFDSWKLVDSFNIVEKAELNESLLEKDLLEVIEFRHKNDIGEIFKIDLFVKEEKYEQAKLIIDSHINWIKFRTYESIYLAQLFKDFLEENNIRSVLINEQDSSFLLGEIDLFIELENEIKAEELLDEFNKSNSQIDLESENIEQLN